MRNTTTEIAPLLVCLAQLHCDNEKIILEAFVVDASQRFHHSSLTNDVSDGAVFFEIIEIVDDFVYYT